MSGANKKGAVSFDDLIAKNRASKLANQIMGKNRTGTVPPAGNFSKRRAVPGNGVTTKPQRPSNISKTWTHDLHHKVNLNASRVSKLPTTISPAIAKNLQNNRLFAALHSDQVKVAPPPVPTGPSGANKHRNPVVKVTEAAEPRGFSIRGSAGPAVIQANNFALGTTAEDIRHAMAPLGNIMSCIILTALPTVICEIIFENKEAGDKCIQQYHGQRADGRVLEIFFKNTPPVGRIPSPTTNTHNGIQRYGSPQDPWSEREEADRQRREANVTYQDGRYGVKPPPLYSDALMQKGRGFSHG